MLEEEKAGGCGQDRKWKGGPESGSLQGSRQEITVMGGGGEEGKRQLGGGVGYTGAYYSYLFMRREEGQWLQS